jgi:antitoxin component YwqK of YwqJK toxin-antitoxin module
MKKLLLLLFSLMFSLNSFADVELDFDLSDFCFKQPGVQERGNRYFFPNEPKGISATSICVHKYAYGQYESKGKLKNGSPHGYWVVWYENGQKKHEGTYINGEIDFAIGGTSWNEYGQISMQAKLNEGKLVSLERDYFDKTVLSNGKIENQIKSEINYVDEMKHGKELTWYENGQLSSETNYLDDMRNGKALYWYENGQLSSEINYKDNQWNGLYIEWYENGQLKHTEVDYKDGEAVLKDGKWIQWYENGQKKSESVIVNNMTNGKETSWHENGQIKSVGNFKDNKKEGKWSYWDTNGVLSLRENRKNGERIY